MLLCPKDVREGRVIDGVRNARSRKSTTSGRELVGAVPKRRDSQESSDAKISHGKEIPLLEWRMYDPAHIPDCNVHATVGKHFL
jgi:hypothetical protein